MCDALSLWHTVATAREEITRMYMCARMNVVRIYVCALVYIHIYIYIYIYINIYIYIICSMCTFNSLSVRCRFNSRVLNASEWTNVEIAAFVHRAVYRIADDHSHDHRTPVKIRSERDKKLGACHVIRSAMEHELRTDVPHKVRSSDLATTWKL